MLAVQLLLMPRSRFVRPRPHSSNNLSLSRTLSLPLFLQRRLLLSLATHGKWRPRLSVFPPVILHPFIKHIPTLSKTCTDMLDDSEQVLDEEERNDKVRSAVCSCSLQCPVAQTHAHV